MASFIIGDYEYDFYYPVPNPKYPEMEVRVVDKTKVSYEPIPQTVTYNGKEYVVTGMNSCFANCTSMEYAPELPTSSNNITMDGCFYNCTSLVQAPVITQSVTSMNYCFYNCTSLTGDIYVYSSRMRNPNPEGDCRKCFLGTTETITLHAMNNNINTCNLLASTSENDNVYVNVKPESPITFSDTKMNYVIDGKDKLLSLQTNASLVQCQVPDLVHGGEIVTNVNDALIDLYRRGKIGGGA